MTIACLYLTREDKAALGIFIETLYVCIRHKRPLTGKRDPTKCEQDPKGEEKAQAQVYADHKMDVGA